MALKVVVNGEERSVEALADGDTLDRFVGTLSFRPDRVAVERNGQIVPRTQWASTVLSSGDRLEVVHFVGGGSVPVSSCSNRSQ